MLHSPHPLVPAAPPQSVLHLLPLSPEPLLHLLPLLLFRLPLLLLLTLLILTVRVSLLLRQGHSGASTG